MPDLRQALKDFVATSNSGKYADEATLLSKFPELQGYDVNVLKDFVATSNSGKYATEDELFSKFPEFNLSFQQPTELKKKDDTTALPSEVGSSVSSVSAEPEMAKFGYQPGKPLPEQIPSVQPDQPVQPEYTEEVMIGPMGISGVKTTGRAQEFQGKSIPKVVGELGKVLAKGIIKFPADVVETAAIASAAAKNLAAKTGLVDETTATQVTLPTLGAGVNFFQAASEWKNLVDDFIPTEKDIESGFWGQTANALGQMVPILLTGGMSGGGRAIAKEAGKKGLSMQAVANYGKDIVSRIGTAQGAITISQVAAPSYEQAKLEGATENEALGYAIQNAVMTFPLEMLPVSNLFKRLDNVLVGNTGVEVLKRAVVGGGEELITEGVQAIYENVTADAIYGTTREFLDGVGEASAVGGTVGAIMNGLLTALLGRRARAKSDKEIEEIDKSIKDVEQKIAQVESNNESINETVKALEENKLRKLSYGSADYNFIESPEGALEYADDALTEQQAQGIVGNLANSYKKIDFKIEEVEPEDPYQPTTYKIIGTPKTTQQDAIQEQAAGEVPVQPTAPVSQELEEGTPQAESQVVAQEGQEEVTPEAGVSPDIALVVAPSAEPKIETEEVATEEVKTEEVVSSNTPSEFALELQDKYGVELDLLGGPESETLSVSRIIVPKEQRGKGVGAKVMEEIIQFADSNNKKLVLTPSKDFGGTSVKRLTDFYKRFGFVENKGKNKDFTIRDTMYRVPEVSAQPEAISAVSPIVAPDSEATTTVSPEPAVQPSVEPITITDIKINFIPENAIEVEKGTREDTTGRKFTYNAAVTSQATDQNGSPIGTMTKRSNEDGVLSFTVKDVNGRKINKGKSYPTERDARMALAEQVNKVIENQTAKQKAKQTSVEAEQVINSEESSPELAERALAVFENLDKQLDNKLKRNANDALLAIPLTTLQAAVKAVKVLIKGGIAVRDAIRRVAAENKIDENRLREAFVALTKPTDSIEDTYEKYHVAPESGHTKIDVKGNEEIKKGETFGTVTYSNKEEGDVVVDSFSIDDIDKLSNRSSGFITTARNVAQGFISIKPSPKEITEQLFGKGKSYEKLSDANKAKVDKERIKQTTQFKLPWSDNKALKSLNAYINKNKDSKPSDYYDVVKKKSKDIINSFKEEVKNNLRALYNNVSEDFKETSRQWYDGANRLAQNISESYGISLEQSAGILAALSPKNNWFNNISAAERVIRAWADHQNTTVTKEMVDRTIAYMERNGEAPFAKNIRTAFAKTKGRSISELTEEYKKTGSPEMLEAIGITMRIIDQSEYSPIVYSVSPEGFIDGKYGVIGWAGGAALSNAVSMLVDPSMKNISSRLGNGNKVRNFYGNIIDPQNAEFLTADTHAFAAGLMLPSSANEAQDFGLFKGGMSTEYAIFKDAYIEVAKEFGILPRELQSITWEAVRGSINIDNRTPSMVRDINKISEELLNNGESNENRTNEILRKYPIKFSKGEWSNKRGIVAQATVLGSDESLRQTADTGRGTTVSGDLRGRDAQVGERAAGRISFDEVADLDVKSKDNLAIVADFLDSIDRSISKRLKTNANDALLAIPLTAVQGMVKGLKVLVQGGMAVRDAIKKIAADNNISQDKLKELLNLMPIQEEFNALLAKADALIARQKSKNIEDKRILSNAETMLRKEPAYINATDAQRKIMEREVRAKMGAEPRKAASIGRVIGALKDITNVTREEKLKIISRIRELGRDVAKDLAAEIRAMANGGTITTKQAGDIIARFGKVNMLNEISVSNFVEYMSKVLANAEYVAQLETAKSARKKLRSLSKDKKKSANLRDLAAKFVDIDPTMVDDIDAYNKVAKKIKESVEGSSIKGKDVKFADIVKEGTVVPYIDETLKAQNEKLYQERLKEAKDIFGIDAKDLSYDELLVLLSEGKEKEKQEVRFSFENLDTNELINTIINAFDVYSSILESSIRTGVDPFTGEQVAYTDTQKKLISEFIKMDLNILSPKQALEAVDSLLNFIQNNSTAKMESILRAYQGDANVRGLVEDKVKASPLRKYWSKPLGRILGEQLTNLDLLIEKMFKGFRQGLKIAKDMGLTDIKNGKSQAVSESNKIVNEYVSQFYDKKANGEVFNTDFNDVERGMTAFMMRNVIGTEAEMKAEFNRRKQLVKESIDELAQGDEREASYSEIYQQVYDKILKDAKTIDDVTSKVDNVNLDAVKFWQSKWSDKYEELSDVSLNVYNKVLEKDINYTPDRQSKLSTDNDPVEISTDDMVFHSNNGTIYKKETGVLMEATRPKALPKNPNTGLPSRYISLSFDKNNSNAMYDALVDIKTAGPIRQAEAFVNSKSFRKLVTQAEDAKILKDRIRLYVNNIRNKNPYSNDEVSKLLRGLNSVASIGVGQALGGVFQPIKQMIPVGVNTLINAKGFDMGSMFDKAKQEFLNNSGYGIASRGAESQAQIESLNNLIKKASESKGDRAIRLLEEANKLQLKIFLVKPDAYIARASWMTYYEQELNRLGIDPNTIDYTTHKINKKAADYAEAMVNRQQNVSDADLAGKLLGERSDEKQMFVKLLMPFASFRMNQSARVGADVGTFLSKTATKEDKAIAARSLSGFAAEMVTFRAISVGTGLVISAISGAIMGSDEEDNEKKKDSIIKGQLTSTVGDVFSPIPYTDKFIQSGVAGALDIVQDAMDIDEEDRLTIFSGRNQELLESLGLFGISLARGAQLVELIQLSTTGSYKDNFGKKKYISDDSKKTLRLLIGPALLTNTGLLPVEVNSVIRSSISAAKKKSSTKEGGPSIPDYESKSIKRMEKDLLEGYENKTEMKRYDPELYEQNFGEDSEYYELTKERREEEKKAREEEQKEKDAEYGYREKGKGFGSRSKSSGKGFGAKKFGKD